MAAHVKAVGKKLRPHSKTHKCPEIARRQIAAGAVGICCAKVGEAEVMTASGIRNILVTTEVVGPEKIGRLWGVLDRAPETMVGVDNAENIRELGQAMTRAGRVLNVLVDVDVGGRRTGSEPGEPAVHLGRLVTLETALNLRGLQGYAGHCAHIEGYANRRKNSHRWMNRLMKTRELFEKNGRLMAQEQGRLPALGQLMEFSPPHCDPTINLYDRIYAMRGAKVEAIWDIAARGRGQ